MVTDDPKEERAENATASAERSAPSARPSVGAGVVRVGALGLNAWAVAIALPASAGGVFGTADLVLIALPLVALVLGLRALARSDRAALGLLAVGVPVLLVTGVAARADPALGERYGTVTMILAAFSTLAYVIATADVLGRPPKLHTTKESKLALGTRARPAARGLRALVLGTTSTVAMLLAVVLPALGSHQSAMEAWGPAADEGRVLTAIVGGAIACITTAAIVGPALRAPRSGAVRPGERTLPVTLSLVVAATGAIAYAILTRISR
jgi:hypothetical protein